MLTFVELAINIRIVSVIYRRDTDTTGQVTTTGRVTVNVCRVTATARRDT